MICCCSLFICIYLPYLSNIYYQLSRGQDCVLPCAFSERITLLLPRQLGLRDPLGHTHQLSLTVFHHCYLLLTTMDGRWD